MIIICHFPLVTLLFFLTNYPGSKCYFISSISSITIRFNRIYDQSLISLKIEICIYIKLCRTKKFRTKSFIDNDRKDFMRGYMPLSIQARGRTDGIKRCVYQLVRSYTEQCATSVDRKQVRNTSVSVLVQGDLWAVFFFIRDDASSAIENPRTRV